MNIIFYKYASVCSSQILYRFSKFRSSLYLSLIHAMLFWHECGERESYGGQRTANLPKCAYCSQLATKLFELNCVISDVN